MVGVLVRGGFQPHDAVGHRRHAAGAVDRARRASRCTSTRCAASTRCTTHARRSGSTRSRTASTSCSRSCCSRRSACRVSRWRGAVRTPSPRSSRSSCSAAGARTRSTAHVGCVGASRRIAGPSRSRSLPSPLAAAIGARHGQSRAFAATAVAGLAGGVAYVIVLVVLRTPELGSLVGVLRRRAADADSTCNHGASTCNHGRVRTDRNYPDPRRSHGRSRRDRQCL